MSDESFDLDPTGPSTGGRLMPSREQSSRGMPPPPDDELVPLSKIATAIGVSEYKAHTALTELGDQVLVFPHANGRVKLYPLQYTLQLLQQPPPQDTLPAGVESDSRVPIQVVAKEIGWTTNTVKRYMASARRSIFIFPGEGDDRRKRLYPLRHTLRVLRREHARTQGRRERGRDEAAGYWTTLAQLKVTRSGLKQLRVEAERLEAQVDEAFRMLRRRPPRSEVEIRTLPDTGLELRFPICAIVAPLRLVYWKATVPEIPLRGEGREPEDAVVDLREKLCAKFRQLQAEPAIDPLLGELLSEFIRLRRRRRTREEMARAADEGDCHDKT